MDIVHTFLFLVSVVLFLCLIGMMSDRRHLRKIVEVQDELIEELKKNQTPDRGPDFIEGEKDSDGKSITMSIDQSKATEEVIAQDFPTRIDP